MEVVEGMDVVTQIKSFGSESGRPGKKIAITGCGDYSPLPVSIIDKEAIEQRTHRSYEIDPTLTAEATIEPPTPTIDQKTTY